MIVAVSDAVVAVVADCCLSCAHVFFSVAFRVVKIIFGIFQQLQTLSVVSWLLKVVGSGLIVS